MVEGSSLPPKTQGLGSDPGAFSLIASAQPKQSCETAGSPPGNAGSAPGSAFNQDGGTAGSNYAGEKPQNSRNTASSSQYDVACSKQPN